MCRPPCVNLGPPNISKTTRARKLKLKTQLHVVNLGPPDISETTTARELNLKIPLDIMVKYPHWVQKFLR